MSLVQGYSSDEDDGPHSATNDAFGLTSIPVAKKLRVDEPSTSLVPTSAPDVLAEVCGASVMSGRVATNNTPHRIHYTQLRWLRVLRTLK